MQKFSFIFASFPLIPTHANNVSSRWHCVCIKKETIKYNSEKKKEEFALR